MKFILKYTRADKKQILLPALWWLFWLILQTVMIHRIGLPWLESFYESAITTIVLALSGFVISNTFRYYRPVSQNNWLLIGYVIILTLIIGRLLFYIFKTIHDQDIIYQETYLRYMPLRGSFYIMMISFLTLYYYYRNKLRDIGNIKKREFEADRLYRDAELAGLRQQLQPHFLFNSLNSISALAGSKPEEARKMIQQLSDFLRGTIRKDTQQLITLKDELQHIQLYLEIEKVRFGHRLQTNIMHESEIERKLIPALILQPIVENAVKFGLYDTTENVTIEIKAMVDGNVLVVQVVNPFDPATATPKSGTSFGLSAVRKRLSLLFARHDLLETSAQGQHYITTIKIPQPS
jgi:two-component system, LytTR family, sensor kinase